MDFNFIVTKLLPILLVIIIVAFNLYRINKQIKNSKEAHNGCAGGCSGCAQQDNCNSADKK